MVGVWRILISVTATGVVVNELLPADVPTYTVELNSKGAWGCELILGTAPNVASDVMGYVLSGKHTWTVVYDGSAVQGGPVGSYQFSQKDNKLSVSGPGFGANFDNREVRNPAGDPLLLSSSGNNKTMSGMSLREIARQLVVDSTTPTGQGLPLDLSDGLLDGGTATRTYNGFDMADVWKRVEELSQVVNGPEFVFRPYTQMTSGVLYVMFKFALGNPLLGNATLNELWEADAAFGSIDVDGNTAIPRPHRAWAKGSGDQTTAIIGQANNSAALIAAGYPYAAYLNTGHSDTSDVTTLNGYATSDLAEFAAPLETWDLSVRIDGTNAQGVKISPALGGFLEGDQPQFRITRHPIISDGTYRRRIIGYSNGNAGTVKLKLQPA